MDELQTNPPSLPLPSDPAALELDLPYQLSVIIPARDEEASLPACLASILSQSEPGFALGQQWELIVIDDASTDRTRALTTQAFAGLASVALLEAGPLDLTDRGGFTGKNAACWLGAQNARGRWLLFTDADTVHEPGDLSRSLREAERYKASLLSYSPRQIVTGFWQTAVMPIIFSELASVYPPRQVSDPANRLAAANGQFLLVDREAYFSVGGHRGVSQEILEDVALARRIKRGERTIRFRYAPEALSTRMYRTLPEMIEGWTKNLALLFPSPVALAFWRVLDLVLLLGLPLIALALPAGRPTWQPLAILLIWARTLWRYYARVARSNFPAASVAVSVAGLPLFVYLLLASYRQHKVDKSVAWKGRKYRV